MFPEHTYMFPGHTDIYIYIYMFLGHTYMFPGHTYMFLGHTYMLPGQAYMFLGQTYVSGTNICFRDKHMFPGHAITRPLEVRLTL